MSRDVAVVGVGVHPFGKVDRPLMDLAVAAGGQALDDAGMRWTDVQAVVAASSQFVGGFGWRLSGNEFLQAMGESGIPVANLSAACAAGGSAFHAAVNMVASGAADVVLTIGAEKMPRGFIARPPGDPDTSDVEYLRWATVGATNTAYWALEARRRMHDVGTTELDYAAVAVKAHGLGRLNARARFRRAFRLDEVLSSAMVSSPLRLFEICAVSDGAAAAIVCHPRVARERGLDAVWVKASVIGTSVYGDPSIHSPELSATPANGVPQVSESTGTVLRAYSEAGIGPGDVDFVELQDNSVWHELALPELFGLCEPGESDSLLIAGETLPTGKLPVNPSGGFLSFGEATTAMGVWQICETVWQLRGQAADRQVPDARVGLCQVLGLAGTGAATILAR